MGIFHLRISFKADWALLHGCGLFSRRFTSAFSSCAPGEACFKRRNMRSWASYLTRPWTLISVTCFLSCWGRLPTNLGYIQVAICAHSAGTRSCTRICSLCIMGATRYLSCSCSASLQHHSHHCSTWCPVARRDSSTAYLHLLSCSGRSAGDPNEIAGKSPTKAIAFRIMFNSATDGPGDTTPGTPALPCELEPAAASTVVAWL